MSKKPNLPDEPVLYVLSGAGLSAESGVATFRSSDGIWSTHAVNRVCNYLTYKQYREEVFAFYNGRKDEVERAQPNAAHERLAAWQARWGVERVKLLTQNVDDMLERAGAQRVVHLHGDLHGMMCTACGTKWPIGNGRYDVAVRCPKCDSLRGVKPGVVFFGERAPEYAHLLKMRKNIRPRDWLVVVGTSSQVVAPWDYLPVWRQAHELNIQVNPDPEGEEHYRHNIALPATLGLVEAQALFAQAMDVATM